MMWNQPGLWRGLTTLFCFFLALSIVVGLALEANAGTVDACLGTESNRLTEGEDGTVRAEPVLTPWRTAYYSAIGLSGVLAAGCGTLYVLALRRVRKNAGADKKTHRR